jgi:lipopolysaccharide/colanic/teichoic acid biosynthesis glycosyltransferase
MLKRSKFIFLFFDILFITFAFLFFIWLKPASLRIYLPRYIKPFLGFAFLWLVTSFIGNKYYLIGKKKLVELLNPIFRIDFTILGITVILMYVFGRFGYSRMIVFGTILFATALEIVFVIFYYLHRKVKGNPDFAESISLKPRYISPHDYSEFDADIRIALPEIKDIKDSIYSNLKNRYLEDQPKLFQFLDSHLELKRISKNNSLILKTHTFFNIENIEPGSQHFFMNLRRINDGRRMNRYFLQINKNLKTGGYYIGNGETIAEKFKKYFDNYPSLVAAPLYAMDFIFNRIFPKIPILKETYFAFTKGFNRVVSKAEILGRLNFCGFKVIASCELNNLFHFIAVKIKSPCDDPYPSYGPFIKLKRIGKDGEVIYVYKFRTMHPYSEYLQSYIHDKYDLEDSGKFKNDFRITGWGKVFRRLWIDELPQLLNLFRGQLSLVGVRALSEHYFSLYPKDLQKLRIKFKPGLVPPYYADMPSSFDEILESEQKYLESRQKRPFTTNIKYFFKAWWNIIFRNARSK